ncbi:MAG: thioredoxin [Actinobacteria bacterium]|nr:thioredoxin [Actinomycetota bacterium]
MAGNIVVLSDQEFQAEVIDSSTPVLVDFSAEWCGPCKALAPVIEQLSDEYAGRVKFAKVDIDSNRASASQYDIQSVPTMIIFQNGQPVKKLVGLTPKDRITAALDELL